jgi:peptidoglycan/LPS O-acetylase OafA/YrhL
VQALRAIAVLMVVAVHIGNPYGFEPRYLVGDRLLGWVNVPGRAGVDLFLVISGLIMTITTWNVDRGVESSKRFLVRRFRRIYPIYWVVSILVLGVFLVRPDLVNEHSPHSPEVLQSFLLLPQPGLPLLAVGWTLTLEMYFYLVFAAALLAGRRWLPWILGGWGAVSLALALTLQGTTVPVLQLLANPLSLEFVLGVAVGNLVMRRPPVAPAALLGGGIVLMAVGVVIAPSIDSTNLDSWYRLIVIGPAAALIVLGAIGLERQRRLIAPRLMQYLGDASYSIYLWHTLLLVAAGRALAWLLPGNGPWHAVLLIAVPLGVLAATVVLYELIERPLLRLLAQRRTRTPRHVAA